MLGEELIVKSLSDQTILDKYGNVWQYHSQSDRHSKIVCWVILFDLLQNCPLLRQHVAAGKVAFGINHEMTDVVSQRHKKLDLVICRPLSGHEPTADMTFGGLAEEYGISLAPEDRAELASLPDLRSAPVEQVLVALEAKACMTAHQRAWPRLFDELTSSAMCMNGSAPQAIAAASVLVNASKAFISTNQNRRPLQGKEPLVNQHPQPKFTLGTYEVLDKLKVRGWHTDRGFDAVSATTIVARNDGSPIRLAPSPPALKRKDSRHYQRMVHRIAALYDARFKTW